MARIMDPQPGMEIYDPCCGSAGLLIKCRLVHDEKQHAAAKKSAAPIKLYGQENEPGTWAMANMNMIIHDLEGEIQIGDTFRKPKFRVGNRLQAFDRVVANPMWNQTEFEEKDYDGDELGRFPKGAGFPGGKADWGWMQHILASLKGNGRAAVVLDTGAAARGSGNASSNKERDVRRWFLEQDLIEGVLYLPENLFYNTPSPGIIIVLNKAKPKERQGKLFLINASREFVKGDPKNYIPEDAIVRISDTFLDWKEIEKYSRIVTREEIVKKNDCNISPSRYIHTGDVEEYRTIAEIVEELEILETEVSETNIVLRNILAAFATESKRP
jgi:type I restriction enzyme M protein